MRNWLYFALLSGDHIAEQHIHSLDKLAWAKDAYPVKCVSTGGRIKRTGAEYGNVYDYQCFGTNDFNCTCTLNGDEIGECSEGLNPCGFESSCCKRGEKQLEKNPGIGMV